MKILYFKLTIFIYKGEGEGDNTTTSYKDRALNDIKWLMCFKVAVKLSLII